MISKSDFGLSIRALHRVLPLLAAATLCACGAGALQRYQDAENDVPQTWVELDIKLPPYPNPQNLIEFDAGSANTNRFYVDPESLSVGDDGVVRYTLVVKSASGAQNISYEGMRCEMRQQKYYAFGRSNGTWNPARTSAWRRIEYKEINRQHGVLYADYFCPERKWPIKTPAEAIRRLKYGAPPRAHQGE